MTFARLAPLCGLAIIAACGTTVSTRPLNTSAAPRMQRQPETVELFTTAVPTRAYTEVALIEAREQVYSDEDPFLVLRAQAGQMGCDGLILLGAADSTVGNVSATGAPTGTSVYGGIRTLHGYRGTCIVWKEPNDPKVPPPPPSDPRCDPPCAAGFKCWGGVCAAASPAASASPRPVRSSFS